jgi:hypothetical protein
MRGLKDKVALVAIHQQVFDRLRTTTRTYSSSCPITDDFEGFAETVAALAARRGVCGARLGGADSAEGVVQIRLAD